MFFSLFNVYNNYKIIAGRYERLREPAVSSANGAQLQDLFIFIFESVATLCKRLTYEKKTSQGEFIVVIAICTLTPESLLSFSLPHLERCVYNYHTRRKYEFLDVGGGGREGAGLTYRYFPHYNKSMLVTTDDISRGCNMYIREIANRFGSNR